MFKFLCRLFSRPKAETVVKHVVPYKIEPVPKEAKRPVKQTPKAKTDLPWIVEARRHIGMTERTGRNDSPELDNWWSSFNLAWLYNKAWCGLFVAVCLRQAGLPVVKALYRAKSWLNWGESIFSPCYGCIVVFNRKGGGHVGFVVGLDKKGRIMVIGGNQSNKVSIAPFDTSRVEGYRVPIGFDIKANSLSVMIAEGSSSTNEA